LSTLVTYLLTIEREVARKLDFNDVIDRFALATVKLIYVSLSVVSVRGVHPMGNETRCFIEISGG